MSLALGGALAILVGGAVLPAEATDAPSDSGDPAAEDGAPADPEAEARDDQLRLGSEVYTQVCSSCHQPGGAGLSGQFPPLLDNPRIDDTEYVLESINDGRDGELQVGDETFNGVMPSFSTLSDEDKDAVIAYMQNDFAAPQADIDEFEATGPVAGTSLPGLASYTALAAYLLTAAVVALVLAPRLIGVNDRLAFPWLDAWLKTAVIVLAVVLLTIVIPNWALNTTTVAKLDRFAQDFIGTGLFSVGLAIVIGGLWYAHRESRI